MSFCIVSLRDEHISPAVDVHMRSFPGFFLTFLGPRFLREFYGSFVSDPMGIGFVAQHCATNEVLGVVVGPFRPAGYFKRLLRRRWWAFCAASMEAVFKRPRVIRRLFRALFYRGESPSGPERALLSSVCVAPEAKRQGVGKALVTAWVREAQRRGGAGCFLTTDAHNNEATNCFYQSLNWRLSDTFTRPDGRVMNRYVYDFSDAPIGNQEG